MKAKQLKELLATVPDEAEVVVPSQDHEYRRAQIQKTTALFKVSIINEDFGEDATPENEYGRRQIVLVVA